MKIGKSEIKTKTLVIVGVVVAVIAGSALISSAKKNAEKEERLKAIQAEQAKAEAEANADKNNQSSGSEDNPDIVVPQTNYEKMQADLVQQYGTAPEGFMWKMNGDLVAIGSKDMTTEELIYTYIRSLSILDFSTAQKFAMTSYVSDAYENFYKESSRDTTNYYNDFLRKQYKYALTTVEILGLEDTAVFADGTTVATVKIRALDLTNKDFWLEDKDEIYTTLRAYMTKQSESDKEKGKQYLYDYVYSAYEEGKVPKKEYTIEIVLEKATGKAWLVADDSELRDKLIYEKGLNVVDFIMNSYDTWLQDTEKAESKAEAEAEKRATLENVQ